MRVRPAIVLAGCLLSGVAAASYRLAVWPARARSPTLTLVDTDGRVRTLADYRGRLVVIFFGFTHCADACPTELFKLAMVRKQLGPLRERVQVVFITLDPGRDSPEALKRYLASFDTGFVALTGTPAQVDAAAASFFVEYARVGTGANYSIDHSTSAFVLDAGGRLRLVGAMNTAVGDFVHDLTALAAE